MRIPVRLFLVLASVIAALCISSCGGGGGGNNLASPTVAVTSPTTVDARTTTVDAVLKSGERCVGLQTSMSCEAARSAAAQIRMRMPSSRAPSNTIGSNLVANAFMDWAQSNFAQMFGGTPLSGSADSFVYRYYPSTGNYLVVTTGAIPAVYFFGPITDTALVGLGPLSGFLCSVSPQSCQPVAVDIAKLVFAIGTSTTGGVVGWSTGQAGVNYEVHASTNSDFFPSPQTLVTLVRGISSAEFSGLKPDMQYYVRVMFFADNELRRFSDALPLKTMATSVKIRADALIQTEADLGLTLVSNSGGVMMLSAAPTAKLPAVGAYLVGQVISASSAPYFVKVLSAAITSGLVILSVQQASFLDVIQHGRVKYSGASVSHVQFKPTNATSAKSINTVLMAADSCLPSGALNGYGSAQLPSFYVDTGVDNSVPFVEVSVKGQMVTDGGWDMRLFGQPVSKSCILDIAVGVPVTRWFLIGGIPIVVGANPAVRVNAQIDSTGSAQLSYRSPSITASFDRVYRLDTKSGLTQSGLGVSPFTSSDSTFDIRNLNSNAPSPPTSAAKLSGSAALEYGFDVIVDGFQIINFGLAYGPTLDITVEPTESVVQSQARWLAKKQAFMMTRFDTGLGQGTFARITINDLVSRVFKINARALSIGGIGVTTHPVTKLAVLDYSKFETDDKLNIETYQSPGLKLIPDFSTIQWLTNPDLVPALQPIEKSESRSVVTIPKTCTPRVGYLVADSLLGEYSRRSPLFDVYSGGPVDLVSAKGGTFANGIFASNGWTIQSGVAFPMAGAVGNALVMTDFEGFQIVRTGPMSCPFTFHNLQIQYQYPPPVDDSTLDPNRDHTVNITITGYVKDQNGRIVEGNKMTIDFLIPKTPSGPPFSSKLFNIDLDELYPGMFSGLESARVGTVYAPDFSIRNGVPMILKLTVE